MIVSATSAPSRRTVTSTDASPTAMIAVCTSENDVTGAPFTATIRSPDSMPAASAGAPSTTRVATGGISGAVRTVTSRPPRVTVSAWLATPPSLAASTKAVKSVTGTPFTDRTTSPARNSVNASAPSVTSPITGRSSGRPSHSAEAPKIMIDSRKLATGPAATVADRRHSAAPGKEWARCSGFRWDITSSSTPDEDASASPRNLT